MEGTKVLITGATSGIGLATARAFAACGATLVVNGRNPERLAAVAAELGAEAAVFDVRDPIQVEQAARDHPTWFQVDVLVNNAGLARGLDKIWECSPEDWSEMIDTNVKGILQMTRAVVPHMISAGQGHIVNLGSIAGHQVYSGGGVYCATKHAVRALNDALRLDLLGKNVRVTSIDPGLVETNFSNVRFRGDANRAHAVYDGVDPLSAEDIAEAIVWSVGRPPHVNIQEMIVMPTAQASIRDVARL